MCGWCRTRQPTKGVRYERDAGKAGRVSSGGQGEALPHPGRRRPGAGAQPRAILEVLAGARTPAQAASALNVSLPRYYQVEARALRGLVAACAPRPRGPGHSAEREVEKLRRQQERLERELTRQQTLVRLAQRSIGLAPPPAPAKDGSKKRRRRPTARALQAAAHLQTDREPAAEPVAEA